MSRQEFDKLKLLNSPEHRLNTAKLELQRPAMEAGYEQLPYLQESATVGGILGGAGQGLDSLIPGREAAAGEYMQQAGLNRPGAAQAAGQIDINQKLAIEDELNRRRQGIAGMGYQSMGAQTAALGQSNQMQRSASLMQSQQNAQRQTNQANMLGSILGIGGSAAGAGMFGGNAASGTMAGDYTGAAMQNWLAGQ